MGLSPRHRAALSSPGLGLGQRGPAGRSASPSSGSTRPTRGWRRPWRSSRRSSASRATSRQHVGGFVITEGRLDELVPIENAAMEDRTVIAWDKDDIDALGILKVDVLALGHAHLHPQGLRAHRRAPRHPLHAGDAAGRGPGGLRHALPRRLARRLPGRVPGADELPPAAAAALLLRPGHRGGDRASGPDPGRHGASLPAAAARRGAGRVPLGRARGGARQDARGAAVPGAGDADRDHRRGLHARRGRPAAPLARDLQERRDHPHLPRPLPRGHGERTAMRRTSPSAASARSRASAPTASPRATRRASRCSSTPRPGSSATTRRSSPARS